MEIKVLVNGCRTCNAFYKLVERAIAETNADIELTKEDNIVEILKYEVLSTPTLVINEKVIMSGKKTNLDELKKIISNHLPLNS